MTPETYLGDGLYASFDGWQIILRAPRTDGDHFVAIEPEVMAALLRWLRALNEEHGNLAVAAAAGIVNDQ